MINFLKKMISQFAENNESTYFSTQSHKIGAEKSMKWVLNPNLSLFNEHFDGTGFKKNLLPNDPEGWIFFADTILRFYEGISMGNQNVLVSEDDFAFLLKFDVIYKRSIDGSNWCYEFFPDTRFSILSREKNHGTIVKILIFEGIIWTNLAKSLKLFLADKVVVGSAEFRFLTSLHLIIPATDIGNSISPIYNLQSLDNLLPIRNPYLQLPVKRNRISLNFKTSDAIRDEYKLVTLLPHSDEIGWLANPVTGILFPFLKRELQDVSDQKTWSHALASNRLLSNPLILQSEKENFQLQIEQQKENLRDKKFAVLKGVLSPEQIAVVRTYCRDMSQNGYYRPNDLQEINRMSSHNEKFMSFLHEQLVPIINQIVPAPIKASYCYLSEYRHGAKLAAHTDREQCEWNVSIPLDVVGDPEETPWPIYIKADEDIHEINLELGDLGLYRGSKNLHWRNPYKKGKSMTVCFFHFVSLDFEGSLA